MSSHLVIPDTHAHPDFHNNRFKWLGNLITDLKPSSVVCLGDWADMPSLCSYDRGTKGYEGRRYKKDINAAIEAQEFMFSPIKQAKKKRPRFIMLEGNHEYRIKRAVQSDSILDGTISTDDLLYNKFGWEYVPYNGQTPGIIVVDGVAYSHYFTSGIMGRPISGEHPAFQLIVKQYMSCTQGHVHITDYCVRTEATGKKIHGLLAGVYQDYFSDYAGDANNMWWKGVIFKRDVNNGQYDPEWISLDRIKREYNK